MIRVLADANVLVSAALARSPDAPSVQILDAALASRIELVVSPALLAEIESVLARPRLRKYVSAAEVERFLVELAGAVALKRDPPPPHPSVCRDPDDDYLLALSRFVSADYLVSGDLDLHSLSLEDVVVVTPRELVDRLAREA